MLPAPAERLGDGMDAANSFPRALLKRPLLAFGVLLALLMLAAAIFAPLLAPHDPLQPLPNGLSEFAEPVGPGPGHPLGTDSQGRDVLSRLVYGARISLTIGIGAVGLSLLLGLLVEKVSGEPLDVFANRHIYRPLGMRSTGFNPSPAAKKRAAATEFFRDMGGYQCGEVHDRNAKVMGGVSGHAGLFSQIFDLIRYAAVFLQDGAFGNVQLLKPETVREMARNQTEGLSSSRGLGWVIYKPGDGSFGGCFRTEGYGHTGFTGTSIYINPSLDLYVILLTNRLHYGRTDDIHFIRQQVHQRVAEAF